MSRSLDRDDNDRVERPDAQSRMSLSQGRAGGGGETEDDRADRAQGDGLARPEQRILTHERDEVRYGRNRYEWSETERAVIREVGRFRTLDEQDVEAGAPWRGRWRQWVRSAAYRASASRITVDFKLEGSESIARSVRRRASRRASAIPRRAA